MNYNELIDRKQSLKQALESICGILSSAMRNDARDENWRDWVISVWEM